jgi:hypothetical protein
MSYYNSTTSQQMSDTQRLLQASIELIQKDQHIDELATRLELLEADNALLRLRLHVNALRRLKASRSLPALLRPQI